MTPIYLIGSQLFFAGFKALAVDLRTIGHEHIPTAGPAILASNHVGYLDFAFVMLAPPWPRRQVAFLARRELFDHPVAGPLLVRLEQIGVDVHGDPTAALAIAADRLRGGDLVGLHPEGTISPSFLPRTGRSGAIRLARETGAPIIPVAVWGGHRLLTKWRPRSLHRGIVVTTRYGTPFHPGDGSPAEETAALMARIRALLEVSWRTYPQRPAPAPDDWWVPAHLGGSAPTLAEAEARLARQADERRARRAAELRATATDGR